MAQTKKAATKATEIVEVLSDDQIKKLPKEIQQGIVVLNDHLPAEKMNKLNPVLVEYFKLKKEVDDLAYVEGDKNSIDAYKKTDKKFIAYKKAVEETHKEIKKPFQDVIKPLDAFKKIFVEKSKEDRDELKGKFKPYLDEQARKREEKKAKEKEAETKRIAELEEANKGNLEIMRRGQVFNEIKYTIIGGLSKDASMNLSKLSLEALIQEKNKAESIDYNNLVSHIKDYNMLLPEQVEELKKELEDFKKTYGSLYSNKIEDKQKLKEAEYNQRKLEEQKVAPQTNFQQLPTQEPQQQNQNTNTVENDIPDNFTEVYSSDKEFVEKYVSEIGEVRDKFINSDAHSIQSEEAKKAFSMFTKMMFKAEEFIKPHIEKINN